MQKFLNADPGYNEYIANTSLVQLFLVSTLEDSDGLDTRGMQQLTPATDNTSFFVQSRGA